MARPLSPDWVLEIHHGFHPDTPIDPGDITPPLAFLASLDTPQAIMTSGWAAMGTVLPIDSALGVVCTLLQTLDHPLNDTQIAQALGAHHVYPFGSSSWSTHLATTLFPGDPQ